MRRTLARLVALGLLVSASVLPTTSASAGLFNSTPAGFYSVPYAETLLWYHQVGPNTWESRNATFADWASQGFPAPRPAIVRYVKAPWLSTIVAVPTLPGMPTALFGNATPITFEGWARAGFPNPEVTTNLPGYILRYTQDAGDPTIWAWVGPEKHALTLAEWIAAGQPKPSGGVVVSPPLSATMYVGWATSPELFAVDGGSVYHKLTFAEWGRRGYPTPTIIPGGFYKLSWDATIAMFEPAGGIGLLTPTGWATYDYPTPAVVATIPGDEYCYDVDEDAVYYSGATVQDYLTDAEVGMLGVPVDAIPDCE